MSETNEEIKNILAGYSGAKETRLTPEAETEVNNLKVPDEARPLDKKKPKVRIKEEEPENISVSGELLTAGLALALIDTIIPEIACFVVNKLKKEGKKVDAKKVGLNSKQKKELEPIMEAVLNQIEINANPFALLLVSLLSFYTVNIFMQIND